MTTRRDFFISTIVLGAACAAGSLAAHARTRAAAPTPLPSPMRLPVWIDGLGSFSFIVDTGASRSALAAHCLPELPRSTRREDQVRLRTPTGDVEVPTVAITRLATAAGPEDVALGPVRLPVLPRQALQGADGLLGADALAGRSLHLDFVAGTAALSESAQAGGTGSASRLRSGTAHQVEVAVELDAVGRAYVDVDVGRRRLRALLDTGALRSIASDALRLDVATPSDAAIPSPAPASTALRGAEGSLLAATEATLPPLRVGARRWPAGPVLVAALPAAAIAATGRDGATLLLLGLDRLAALEWLTLDYARARLTLSPLQAGRG